MYEANFEFNKKTIGFDSEINTKEIQANLVLNAVIGDKYFMYEQAVSSDVWIIEHNLNKKPSITVVDSADTVIVGDYEYNDLNKVTLYFNAAFAGKAYLN